MMVPSFKSCRWKKLMAWIQASGRGATSDVELLELLLQLLFSILDVECTRRNRCQFVVRSFLSTLPSSYGYIDLDLAPSTSRNLESTGGDPIEILRRLPACGRYCGRGRARVDEDA